MRYPSVIAAALAVLASANAGRAVTPDAPPAWKLHASADGCSVSLVRGKAFVLLNVNPEGRQGLRIHHPDMVIPDREVRPAVLTIGARALALDVAGARTSDATPGFIVSGRSDLRAAFGAGTTAQVEFPPRARSRSIWPACPKRSRSSMPAPRRLCRAIPRASSWSSRE